MPIRLTRHQPQKPGVIGPWSLPRPLLPTRPSGEQCTGGPAGHLQAPRAGLLPLGFAPSHQPGSRAKGHGAGRAGPAVPGGGHGRCGQARPGGRQRCSPWFCHPPWPHGLWHVGPQRIAAVVPEGQCHRQPVGGTSCGAAPHGPAAGPVDLGERRSAVCSLAVHLLSPGSTDNQWLLYPCERIRREPYEVSRKAGA